MTVILNNYRRISKRYR